MYLGPLARCMRDCTSSGAGSFRTQSPQGRHTAEIARDAPHLALMLGATPHAEVADQQFLFNSHGDVVAFRDEDMVFGHRGPVDWMGAREDARRDDTGKTPISAPFAPMIGSMSCPTGLARRTCPLPCIRTSLPYPIFRRRASTQNCRPARETSGSGSRPAQAIHEAGAGDARPVSAGYVGEESSAGGRTPSAGGRTVLSGGASSTVRRLRSIRRLLRAASSIDSDAWCSFFCARARTSPNSPNSLRTAPSSCQTSLTASQWLVCETLPAGC
jgi:hypothetical protein